MNGSSVLVESFVTLVAIAKHAVPADDNQKMIAYWKSIMAHNIVLIVLIL